MYKTKTISSFDGEVIKTRLDAKFRYDKDTAPNQRERVFSAIQTGVDNYLKQRGFRAPCDSSVEITIPQTWYKEYTCNGTSSRPNLTIKVRVRQCVFRQGFNLKAQVASASPAVPLEEILNLYELDKVIKTR